MRAATNEVVGARGRRRPRARRGPRREDHPRAAAQGSPACLDPEGIRHVYGILVVNGRRLDPSHNTIDGVADWALPAAPGKSFCGAAPDSRARESCD